MSFPKLNILSHLELRAKVSNMICNQQKKSLYFFSKNKKPKKLAYFSFFVLYIKQKYTIFVLSIEQKALWKKKF